MKFLKFNQTLPLRFRYIPTISEDLRMLQAVLSMILLIYLRYCNYLFIRKTKQNIIIILKMPKIQIKN